MMEDRGFCLILETKVPFFGMVGGTLVHAAANWFGLTLYNKLYYAIITNNRKNRSCIDDDSK